MRKITNPMEHRLNQRADRYERAVDARIEEQLEAMDKYRVEIIDRTDVMLQIFEQRLDQQRREIQAMRKEVTLPTENRGDNIFALARKTSAPIERYPKELYVD